MSVRVCVEFVCYVWIRLLLEDGLEGQGRRLEVEYEHESIEIEEKWNLTLNQRQNTKVYEKTHEFRLKETFATFNITFLLCCASGLTLSIVFRIEAN